MKIAARFASALLALLLVAVLANPIAAAPVAQDAGTISDLVAENADFATLLAALQAAGLDTVLAGEGPFTVFAPTDEAFAGLDAGTLDALLADPEGALTSVLGYHVVEGQILAEDITDGMEATTVEGTPLVFTVNDGVVSVNGDEIATADVLTDNGVVHIINSVLVPASIAAATDEEAAPEEETTAEEEVAADAEEEATAVVEEEAAAEEEVATAEGEAAAAVEEEATAVVEEEATAEGEAAAAVEEEATAVVEEEATAEAEVAAVVEEEATPVPAAAATPESGEGGWPWWVWTLLALALFGLLWWLISRMKKPDPAPAPAKTPAKQVAPAPTKKAAAATTATVAAATPPPAPAAKPDDLTKIEGVGAKTAGVLNAAGIHTFTELANSSQTDLKRILADAGMTGAYGDPTTWPEQAALAAAGKWSELDALQAKLTRGRDI